MAISILELTNTVIIRNTDANGTVEKDVRAGAMTLYGMYVDNTPTDAAPAYIKFWDHANPTIGTTPPDYVFEIEGNGSGDTKAVNAGDVYMVFNGGTGIPFSVGMSYAVVTTGGTAGTTNPATTVKVDMETS